MLPDLALWSTLIGSNYPCLELILMVPKVFEPLKFDCNKQRYYPHKTPVEKKKKLNNFSDNRHMQIAQTPKKKGRNLYFIFDKGHSQFNMKMKGKM